MNTKKTVVVLGAGPGGYSAAFRAADLGMDVKLVDSGAALGGVCLNVGCIPSKALLHAAQVIEEMKAMQASPLEILNFNNLSINVENLRSWKSSVVHQLTGGLAKLAARRRVEWVRGEGKFTGENTLRVGKRDIQFDYAIIAVGSQPIHLASFPKDRRIIDSTGALELKETKGDLLIVGGGIIGMEMATVYQALGATVTVVEPEKLIKAADADIVAPLYKKLLNKGVEFLLGMYTSKVEARKEGLWVTFKKGQPNNMEDPSQNPSQKSQRFDQILLATGRRPNGHLIGAEALDIEVTKEGFIVVDEQLRTKMPHIFSIGDVAWINNINPVIGNPMLAHKATAQGHVAAEVIAGKNHYFRPRCIPSVAYTNPEIAWVGLTEQLAREMHRTVKKAVFPWKFSGRSLSQAREEGLTKLLFDPETHQILGGGIVGFNAGELINEVGLAIEMGGEAADISLTIHAHPTLSETLKQVSEIFEGTCTDL